MLTGLKSEGISNEEMSQPGHSILFSTLCYFLYVKLIHCLTEVLCTNEMGCILSPAHVVLTAFYEPLTLFQP